MEILTNKQEYILNLIIDYYQKWNEYPTANILKGLYKCKSYNTIYKHLITLEKKNYLILDKNKKHIINLISIIDNKKKFKIPFINIFDTLDIEKNKNQYITYLVKNNKLNNFNINYHDILIIKKDKTYLNNKIVLIKKNNNYYIYKLIKNNNYYLINDKETIFINNLNNIIGKVIYIIKKI